ncbi:MAG: N-acetyl-gamma-glutamyl-phosphate reductase [Sphaerochaetaceae bacterium]
MIKAGVIGATGYAGAKLVSLLCSHQEVKIAFLGSRSYAGEPFSHVYPAMLGVCDQILREDDIDAAASECDVLFLSLPAGLSAVQVTTGMLKKTVVIDLGADFRLHDGSCYEKWYKKKAPVSALLSQAVYGLPELHRGAIKNASLIANPGCYTTTSILALSPVMGLVETDSIIIDALSGVSGAGRGEKIASLYCECDESAKAYGVANHRHTPEIEQELSFVAAHPVMVQFTPHLVPMKCGILATCTATLKNGVTEEQIGKAYRTMYGKEPFVRLYPSADAVESRFFTATNTLGVGWTVDRRTNRIIVVGALDNLYKGAAGQAVENMNIRFGFEETEALAGFSL